jgi:succinoglycan biosynthesis protein ExoV
MRLVHFRGPNGERNFGDELGPWLWARLLGNTFDDNPDEIFLGIGTILNDRVPQARRVFVFGSGVGYGGRPPRLTEDWSIYCVRGPLSADALGIGRENAITDPGVLVRLFCPPGASTIAHRFSYMPHWRSTCEDWRSVCAAAGFGYIDPRADVDTVLEAIRTTGVLVTEAMHGAIVADALRIPWIPVKSSSAVLEFKWQDWCASLDLRYRPYRIVPVFPLWQRPTRFRRAKHAARRAAAAASLRAVALRARPVLSDEAVLLQRVAALQDALERFRRDARAFRRGGMPFATSGS